MRIALLSDIHGNSVALQAALADVARHGGVEGYWILGDLVALGPDPVAVLERLATLPNTRFIRGNTDRYVTTGDRPGPTLDEIAADASKLPGLVEVSNTFAWTQGMVTAAGWLDWLRALPLEMRETLPDGTRFLGVHASPGRDDGPGVVPDMSEAAFGELFTGCDAGLVAVAHTHRPSDQNWNGVRIVNLGAVSLSFMPDKAASYLVLDADRDGCRLEHRTVPYDRRAVIAQLNRIGHPGRSHPIRLLSDAQ